MFCFTYSDAIWWIQHKRTRELSKVKVTLYNVDIFPQWFFFLFMVTKLRRKTLSSSNPPQKLSVLFHKIAFYTSGHVSTLAGEQRCNSAQATGLIFYCALLCFDQIASLEHAVPPLQSPSVFFVPSLILYVLRWPRHDKINLASPLNWSSSTWRGMGGAIYRW